MRSSSGDVLFHLFHLGNQWLCLASETNWMNKAYGKRNRQQNTRWNLGTLSMGCSTYIFHQRLFLGVARLLSSPSKISYKLWRPLRGIYGLNGVTLAALSVGLLELSISPASFSMVSSSRELSLDICKNFTTSKPPYTFRHENNDDSSMRYLSSTSERRWRACCTLIVPSGCIRLSKENPSSFLSSKGNILEIKMN